MVDPTVSRLGALIAEVTRTLAGAGPGPRGVPCFGLEAASGTSMTLLHGLAARGIFRKYELVLDLGDGLGAVARWLAGRLACSAVATAADLAAADAGQALTRRAGLRAQVHHVPVGRILPFGDARFTHVWAVESLSRLADPAAALAEAFRVLRPGGYLAVQELVAPAGGPVPALPTWRFGSTESRRAMLAATGFTDLVVRGVSAEAAERSPRLLAARARFQERLVAADLTALADERATLARALAAGELQVVQLLARRP